MDALKKLIEAYWLTGSQNIKNILIKKIRFQNLSRIKKYHSNKKLPLKVLFIVIHSSVFKSLNVLREMINDKTFEPIIMVNPYTLKDKESMIEQIEEEFEHIKNMNLPVQIISSYKKESDSWVNIKEEINPDIVFFTNPHKLTYYEYYEELFINYISYYVPYSHQISNYGNYYPQYNQLFHNAVFKIFTPHKDDLIIHQKYSDNKGINVEVTGYPATEKLIDKNYVPVDVWKPQKKKKIRIIYAPHHTFNYQELPLSTFLRYSEFMKNLVEKYKDEVQWVFRPHPLLKEKLIKYKDWGEYKTKKYWEFWEEHPNCQISEGGEYIDLFLTSDAMIHDCGSFLAEYLYVNKPVLYLVANSNIKEYFNSFGLKAFEACYHAYKEEDIDNFIKSLIEGKKDVKKTVREKFLEENIYPFFKDKTPSQRIIESIKKDFNII